MRVRSEMTVSDLLDRHPEAGEILSFHGVPLDGLDDSLPLHHLCWLQGVDSARVLDDLQATADAEEYEPRAWMPDWEVEELA